METRTNDYQLRQGERLYIFSTSIVENQIRLTCKSHLKKKFEKDFSIEDFKSMNHFFNEIKTNQDAIKLIDKALNSFKVAVVDEEGLVKIMLYISDQNLIEI